MTFLVEVHVEKVLKRIPQKREIHVRKHLIVQRMCCVTQLIYTVICLLVFCFHCVFYFSVEKSNAKSVFFLNARMDCMYSFFCNKYRVKYLRFPFIFFLLLSEIVCLNISDTNMQENFSCKKIKCKNILVLVSRLWMYR